MTERHFSAEMFKVSRHGAAFYIQVSENETLVFHLAPGAEVENNVEEFYAPTEG